MARKYVGSIVDFFVTEHKVSRVEATRMIDTVLNGIAHQLREGNEVIIRGHGTFRVSRSKPRKNKGFGKTETMTKPRAMVSFRACPALRDWLEQGYKNTDTK